MLFRSAQELQKLTQEGPKRSEKRTKDNEGRANGVSGRKENEKITRAVPSEAGDRKENEKITRAVPAKQAAEKRPKR